ncbi:hypothetical protein FIBSPDRAFT_901513 [Athelia psychrophila]|uniref:Uncharacterized protein n=1 Tax=Athelia psychrophila TaxID=1759441 RepID=A0A165X2R2_9AGAM|nr:hypothetical protein FIBSPDRAFT_901513 [Fibularhizoctonia sp. CBS 109695]
MPGSGSYHPASTTTTRAWASRSRARASRSRAWASRFWIIGPEFTCDYEKQGAPPGDSDNPAGMLWDQAAGSKELASGAAVPRLRVTRARVLKRVHVHVMSTECHSADHATNGRWLEAM